MLSFVGIFQPMFFRGGCCVRIFTMIFFVVGLGGSLAFGADSSFRNLDKRECPILDTPYRTLSGLEIGYIFTAPTDAPGWGEISVSEVDAWVRCLDIENDSGGEFEICGQMNVLTLQLTEGSEIYPLMRAGFNFQWNQRFVNGFGMELNATPGLYSVVDQVDGESFSVPFGLTGIMAFSGDSAVYAGVNVYPNFQQTVDPVLGFRWSDRDDVVVQIGYPETRVEYSPSREFRLITGAQMALWPDYSMGDDARERIQYSEGRGFGRVEFGVTEFTMLSIEGGYAFERTISFASSSDDVEVEGAPYVRFGIHGSM